MPDSNPNGVSDARVTESHRRQNLTQFPNHVPFSRFRRVLQGPRPNEPIGSVTARRVFAWDGHQPPSAKGLQDERHRGHITTHGNGVARDSSQRAGAGSPPSLRRDR